MPTVFEINGYRFFFYSNENDEPIHIHITRGGGSAKYWMVPNIEEVYSYNFKVKEQKEIKTIINDNADKIIEKWNEFFK